MAMEVAGTENWRRNSPARRPISPRCWPVEPPYCGWASSWASNGGRPRVVAAVVRARFWRRVRRVSRLFIDRDVPRWLPKSRSQIDEDSIARVRRLKELAQGL